MQRIIERYGKKKINKRSALFVSKKRGKKMVKDKYREFEKLVPAITGDHRGSERVNIGIINFSISRRVPFSQSFSYFISPSFDHFTGHGGSVLELSFKIPRSKRICCSSLRVFFRCASNRSFDVSSMFLFFSLTFQWFFIHR